MTLRIVTATALLALTLGCGREAAAPSAEENRELDRAAEMLDQAPENLSKIDDGNLTAEPDPVKN